ncbi:pyruvate dehydrogenase complex dihydrolipoamide acetyltransferase [Mesohalobacter halotolerans]|uniref:Acetyltransferase component of pyruvate dehydrogenase complex n=1 Tax=Mesohalobacter halotolerans TaxID=1883405 RepID=A0A4U5TQF2_9FLAO|nr:pyruvate dehydrogenase complex dihydrolipoamide acetyltransferase [Mesohalobacter halotolerans]MBS3739226.1 pyruvate dehydrogenase complex dihydrolipoamide acetyltransferase [Psychroflexus sp.]TKS56273.1 pyruvate dehydrogenase complex dihydrolipoamide acetyltransferase [Mesohalobacter halotolerans]
MAEVVNMPRLSDTMEEGVVAKWLKKKGDKVEEGDILAEIETDKATMEFESFYDGTLLHIGIEEGDGAPVDSLLAIIGEEGEDISNLIKEAESKENNSEKEESSDDKKEEDDTNDDSEDSGEMPEGVEVVTMPRLSDTMEEGTVASWLKKKGDKVEEGDILAEIETDKATMEFESFYDGTLLHIGIEEGGSAPVDDVLAIIGPEGTDVDAVLKKIKSGDSSADSSKGESSKTKETSKDDINQSESSPSEALETADGERIFASPLARKMAEEKGYDLAQIKGSGENGRVVKKDIENYTPQQDKPTEKPKSEDTKQSTQPVEVYKPVGEEQFEEVKNSQMRKTIAKRLAESKFNAPHYYLDIEVDMDNAMDSRQQINEIPDTKISFNDLVIKASAMALRKHPQVNSQWQGDVTKIAKHIHIGVAVAVEEGLVVPVLEFTDQQSLTQIGQNVKSLATKARDKKLQPDEMEGSTFTVSNLGMFGITEFTSIINQPNSAILSVGVIVEKPVVKNGEIVVGHTMKLTLACDHRTVDGATGAKFLQTLKTYIENPVTMLA